MQDVFPITGPPDGTSDAGEFAEDLGGHIPFGAFLNPNHPLFYSTLQADVFEHFNDLPALDAAIQAGRPGSDANLSLLQEGVPGSLVQLIAGPLPLQTWWGLDAQLWHYKVNGGYLNLVWADQGNPEVNVLVFTERTHTFDLASPGFLPASGTAAPPFAEFGLFQTAPTWTDGGNNLFPEGRALASGDVVALIFKNNQQSLWTQMQRNQETEYFLRNHFLPSHLTGGRTVGRSFLVGGSWGAAVSMMLGLLQPNVYSGVLNMLGVEQGFHIVGDWRDLHDHFFVGTGLAGPLLWPVSSYISMNVYQWVDILGIRFDAEQYGHDPWDLAVFSANHRPAGDLQVPLFGVIGTEDWVLNYHWQVDDGVSSATNPLFHGRYFKNISHGAGPSFKVGVNEAWFYDGNEWTTLLAEPPITPTDVDLVPGVAPDPNISVRPDPYSHTLRHEHCDGICPFDSKFLTALDLNIDSPSDVIGQGVWTGAWDTMEVADLDGDGDTEVFFGNFDGFFHVLELDLNDPQDPLLRDEWQSKWLGTGLWSMARDETPGSQKVFLGDMLGRLHQITATGLPNGYKSRQLTNSSNPLIAGSLYKSYVGAVYRGEFAPDLTSTGKEFLLLNKQLDWLLLDKTGAFLGRLNRKVESMGPGQCAVVADVPGFDEPPGQAEVQELIIPCLDGHLWALQWNGIVLDRFEIAPYFDRALYRVIPVDEQGADGVPEKLLLFARKATYDHPPEDGIPDPELILVYDFAQQQVVQTLSTTVKLAAPAVGVSFAWIVPPEDSGNWSFVLGSHETIQKYTFASGLVQESTPPLTLPSVGSEGVEEKLNSFITSVAYLASTAAGNRGYVFVATTNGRIFVFHDMTDGSLTPARTAADENVTIDPGLESLPWYSNRTFGHEMAMDVYDNQGAPALYVAEYTVPYARDPNPGLFRRRFRTGRLDLDFSTPPFDFQAHWHPDEFPAENTAGDPFHELTRRLDVDDYDNDLVPEPYFLTETGAVIVENSIIRQFCTRSSDSNVLSGAGAGYLFEKLAASDYTVLTNFSNPTEFTVPKVDPNLYENPMNQDWFWPKVGTRVPGQISADAAALFPWAGTGTTRAWLKDHSQPGEPLAWHVLTGTVGGYVYAVRPGDTVTGEFTDDSRLNWGSELDLGWYAMGLDAGNLDTDPEDEIVVGTFLDTGSFNDWVAGDASRNRGKLYILDPNDAVTQHGGFTKELRIHQELTGQSAGVPGLGAGVFGVKIDNVDNAGDPEIWCTDAVGHIYLMRDSDPDPAVMSYVPWYRSGHVGTYPGIYNLIFPIKEQFSGGKTGVTKRLIVVSSGYVMAFDVDATKLFP